jgi:2,2-dialkylglycine decarboxylase (pyruvate)
VKYPRTCLEPHTLSDALFCAVPGRFVCSIHIPPSIMPAPTLSNEVFWETADDHLIRYSGSGDFVRRVITKASGCTLYDSDGKPIIDWTSGQMSAMLGHAHPEIIATINDAMSTLDHLFSGFVTRPVVDAAAMLSSMLPESLSKVMFLNTGAESNEAALRLAKLYTGKHEVVSFSASWRESCNSMRLA